MPVGRCEDIYLEIYTQVKVFPYVANRGQFSEGVRHFLRGTGFFYFSCRFLSPSLFWSQLKTPKSVPAGLQVVQDAHTQSHPCSLSLSTLLIISSQSSTFSLGRNPLFISQAFQFGSSECSRIFVIVTSVVAYRRFHVAEILTDHLVTA